MAGITLSGTTLRCEDNANADASGDGIAGEYSFKDFAIKDAVNCVDLATSQQSYRGVANIQCGDGAGSALTTIKDVNAAIVFNASRGLLTALNAGISNRRWELGTKIIGANGKASGRDGCKIISQAASTLRGTVKLFACHIKQASGTFAILPGAVGLPSDLADLIIESSGNVSIGDSTGEVADAYNIDISLTGTLNTVVQWNVTRAERVTIFGNTQRLISTAGVVRVRDIVLGGTPTIADMRATGGSEWDLVDLVWTGAAAQISAANNYINDWRTWLRTPVNGNTLAPYANLPILVLDKNGAIVVPLTYTDSQGNLDYGASDPTTRNAIKARRNIGAVIPVWEELGPFTARYNLDGATLPQVLGEQEKFNFPRVTGAFGDQLLSIVAPKPLVPLGGSGSAKEEYRTQLA